MNAIATTSGPRSWIARRWAALCVAWKLRWAEEDREFLALQVAALPERLKAMDRDIAALRVEQALLRSGQ